jgi:branched-chain amino acid transport system permease protein
LGSGGPVKQRFAALPDQTRRRWALAGLALAVLIVAVLPWILGTFLSRVLVFVGVFLLMAFGLNIVVGFAGLLDLGYVAFFAVGAYTTAVLMSPISPAIAPELTFFMAIPFIIIAGAIAGLMVGTPVLRMRGDYLAIVTLGFGEIARLLFLSDALTGTFGGAQGLRRVPDISIFGFEFVGSQWFFYPVLFFVLVAAYVSWSLQESRMGRGWMAMREDQSVAEAMGVNYVSAKLWAFVIGAILGAFGGALFAINLGSVFPHFFDIIVSITVLVIIIVGGLGSLPGVVVGALVIVLAPELLAEFVRFLRLFQHCHDLPQPPRPTVVFLDRADDFKGLVDLTRSSQAQPLTGWIFDLREPEGELGAAVDEFFGSFDGFRAVEPFAAPPRQAWS